MSKLCRNAADSVWPAPIVASTSLVCPKEKQRGTQMFAGFWKELNRGNGYRLRDMARNAYRTSQGFNP
ncbi:MAG TPA: hypothetical protein VE242_15345 [Chthoniobacterales bacterium]|nr:hypothetical protein [Chthoniobacterales bacterium]